MMIYFSIIFVLYYGFVLLLIFGWMKSSTPQASQNGQKADDFVTIVVAVRNEAKNILNLMSALEAQNYPKDHFEVIMVDDRSEDDTLNIIEDFKSTTELILTILRMDSSSTLQKSPKKEALEKGISIARGEIILATDGDCWMNKDWLRSMVRCFSAANVNFVSGPVVIQPDNSFFSKIQALEFSSLIGSSAALINFNYPLMCNGANLAFRKAAFLEIGGYEGVDHHASGDDVYLMQKMHHRFHEAILFNQSKGGLVFTSPQETLKSLIIQRKRWASKWNTYSLTFSWAIPVFLFVHYVSFLSLLMLPFFKPGTLWFSILFIAIKVIMDMILLKKVNKFCNLKFNVLVFIATELFYPFYTIVVGVLVHFGKWSWKGRKHKT